MEKNKNILSPELQAALGIVLIVIGFGMVTIGDLSIGFIFCGIGGFNFGFGLGKLING